MLDKGSSNGGCCSISETSFFLKKENIISPPYTVIIPQKIKNRNPFVSELRFFGGNNPNFDTKSIEIKRAIPLQMYAIEYADPQIFLA